MDPHNCYFEHLIIHTEKLTIPFDRHTLNGDSHKILEMVFVRYVLFKDELILKTVTIICPKSRLNLATRQLFTTLITVFSTQM